MTARELSTHIMTELSALHSEEEARAMTRMLLDDLFQVETADVVVNREVPWDDQAKASLNDALTRMKQNEPIQYILGHAWFRGRKFKVSPGVLIPRPETEELVDMIVRDDASNDLKVLDIGCGSGCIAVSLALELPKAQVHACDINQMALNITGENAHAFNAGIRAYQLDILQDFPEIDALDVIVSNPPYVLESEQKEMATNVLEYEPGEALFVPDDDPLRFYNKIVQWAVLKLKPGGRLYLEINERFGKEVEELIQNAGLERVKVTRDLQGKNRMVSAHRRVS